MTLKSLVTLPSSGMKLMLGEPDKSILSTYKVMASSQASRSDAETDIIESELIGYQVAN